MNKSLVKKSNTLSKNMTQTESLTLTNAQVTSITCTMLDLPISAPTNVLVGQCYFNPATHKFFIADGTKKADGVTYNWYSIQLALEP